MNIMIKDLSELLATKQSLINVVDTLEQYMSHDWKQYVNFTDDNYHRELVYHCDAFDLVVISWVKGQKTPIHDHPDQGCLMKVLQGLLVEKSYENDGWLTYLSTRRLEEGQIGYKEGNQVLHDIHALENSVSIHIYSPGGYQVQYF
jgi:cysteine dioxygenase